MNTHEIRYQFNDALKSNESDRIANWARLAKNINSSSFNIDIVMHNVIKIGTLAQYKGLRNAGVPIAFSGVTWAATGTDENRRAIFRYIVENENVDFSQSDYVALKLAARNPDVDVFMCLYHQLLPQIQQLDAKKSVDVYVYILLDALRKDNLEIVKLAWDNLPDLNTVRQQFSNFIGILTYRLSKSKPVNSAMYLLSIDFPEKYIPFDAIFKKSHKDQKFQDALAVIGEQKASKLLSLIGAYNKKKLLKSWIEDYQVVPKQDDEGLKAFYTYLSIIDKSPLEFLSDPRCHANIKAFTLYALSQS